MEFNDAIVEAKQSIEASMHYDNDGIAYAILALALAMHSVSHELYGIKTAIENKLT